MYWVLNFELNRHDHWWNGRVCLRWTWIQRTQPLMKWCVRALYIPPKNEGKIHFRKSNFLSLLLSLPAHSIHTFSFIYGDNIAHLVQFGRWDLKVHSAYRNVVVSWEAVARSIPHLWESNNALRKPSNGPRLQVSFTVFIQVFLIVVFFLFCLRFWIFSVFHIAIIFYTTFGYLLTALLLIYNNLKALLVFYT